MATSFPLAARKAAAACSYRSISSARRELRMAPIFASNLAGSVSGFVVGEHVVHAEGRGAELQGEPGGGARLRVGERQRRGQEFGNRSLLAGFGFETDEQGELGHGVILGLYGWVLHGARSLSGVGNFHEWQERQY